MALAVAAAVAPGPGMLGGLRVSMLVTAALDALMQSRRQAGCLGGHQPQHAAQTTAVGRRRQRELATAAAAGPTCSWRRSSASFLRSSCTSALPVCCRARCTSSTTAPPIAAPGWGRQATAGGCDGLSWAAGRAGPGRQPARHGPETHLRGTASLQGCQPARLRRHEWFFESGGAGGCLQA